jgi:hypothetical protein
MPRKSKVKLLSNLDPELTKTLEELQARESERKREYEHFRTTVSDLAPLDRAAAWLAYVAEHRECDGDLEALVFLASRGRDVSGAAQELFGEWKDAEKEVIAAYNQEFLKRDGSIMTANDVATIEHFFLPNFWSGARKQHHTLAATMLRAVEWCRIGGFAHWWERLAREASQDVALGYEGVAGAFWLFAMCRSDYAVKDMPNVLQRALNTIAVQRVNRRPPWQDESYDEVLRKLTISDSIPCASAIVFAEHRLHCESGFKDEALAAIQGHFDNYSWPKWTCKPSPSIEATAMAMHALGVARPRGWELMMAGARSWLMTKQHEDGFWHERGAPDLVYLTVLVLDALSLATQPAGALTFGRQAATTSTPADQTKRQERRVPATAAGLSWESTAEERRAAVNAYLQEVLDKTGEKLTRKAIWTKAGYKNRSEFERWERADSRATKTAHDNIVRVLTQKPHLKPTG